MSSEGIVCVFGTIMPNAQKCLVHLATFVGKVTKNHYEKIDTKITVRAPAQHGR